jgi:hypothetical protein
MENTQFIHALFTKGGYNKILRDYLNTSPKELCMWWLYEFCSTGWRVVFMMIVFWLAVVIVHVI